MTPLESLLRQHIQTHGSIDVAEYMAQCLYHPQHGYYTNGRNFLPAPVKGDTAPYPHDFTTAPELTPLFGAMLARWVARQYVHLRKPPTFTLMECGPGRGTLMRDMLTCLQIDHPEVYSAAQPLLVETSPSLTVLQQQTLSAFPQCRWSPTPDSTLSTILIANELLDAFPHTQYVIQNTSLNFRHIIINETGNLAFAETGQVDERSPIMEQWLQSLPHTLDAALFTDYGATTSGPSGDTLQALYKHEKVSVFHRPGESDLTTHVNFHHVENALRQSHAHLQAEPLEDLAPFLLRHGLASLALDIQQAAGAPHPATESALHRLLHPAQMGTLFKVSCFTRIRP